MSPTPVSPTAPALLVRATTLLVGIGAYYLLVPHVFPDEPGDAGAAIGAGLLAFALLVVVSGVWAFVDGSRRRFADVAVIWVATGVVVALGWAVGLAITEADASMSAWELFVHDLGLLPFTIGLVVAPAVVGGALGQATAGRTV